ncbi:MAG: hypothetical protein ABIK28_14730 [Planctomycetota bacterium]
MFSYKCFESLAAVALAMMLFAPFLSVLAAQDEGEVSLKELIEKMDAMKIDYEQRISDLELKSELMDSMDDRGGIGNNDTLIELQSREDAFLDKGSLGASSGLMGRLGQTTRFSRTFNPAIGVVADTLVSRSVRSDTIGNMDAFWLRAAEINLSAQVDPFGFAYATVEGSKDEIEVIEAAAVMNRLPANLSLKGGMFLADFGKLGQRHDHELSFVEKPLVYYDYVAGSIHSSGLELHQWFGLTNDIPVRWSVGMLNDMEGHSHTVWFGEGHHHAHDDEHTGFGVNDKRQLDNFAYTGRLTGYGDLTGNASLQIGGSLVWAPEKVDIHEENDVDLRIDTRQAVVGADMTFKWIDPSEQDEFVAGVEGFKSHGTFFHETEAAIEGNDAYGGYAWSEYLWDPHWAVGVMGGAFEMARHDNVGQRELSAWITWKISHFNWLRFQYRFNDLERHGVDFSGRDFSEFMLQWTLVFGTHAHGLDW